MSPVTRNSKQLNDLLSDSTLTDEGQAIVDAINSNIEIMKSEFLAKIDEKNKVITELKAEVNTLKTKMSALEEKIEDADAYERKDTVIFSGESLPDVTAGENCANIIAELLKHKLKLQVKSGEISVAYRVGKKPLKQIRDRRNIVARLSGRDVKMQVMHACTNMPPISCFITIFNLSLHANSPKST